MTPACLPACLHAGHVRSPHDSSALSSRALEQQHASITGSCLVSLLHETAPVWSATPCWWAQLTALPSDDEWHVITPLSASNASVVLGSTGWNGTAGRIRWAHVTCMKICMQACMQAGRQASVT